MFEQNDPFDFTDQSNHRDQMPTAAFIWIIASILAAFVFTSLDSNAQELQRGDLSAAIAGVEAELRVLMSEDSDAFDIERADLEGTVAYACGASGYSERMDSLCAQASNLTK